MAHICSFEDAQLSLFSNAVEISAMDSASINVTSSAEPDAVEDGWSRDEQRWRWCWSAHVYGFGVVFLADCLLCLSPILSSLRKTRDRQSTMGRLLSFTLLLYSLLRSLLLLIDPYNSRALLPCTVIQLINTLAFPCMTLSLLLLDRTLLRLIQPSAEAHVRAITVLSSGYFGFVGAVVVVVCRRSSFRHWELLDQGLFVTCGTVLCCLVASKCLRLCRYSRRTTLARRQIVAFVRSKKQSNVRVTNIRRIRRLKIDDAEHDEEQEKKKESGKNDAEASLDSSSNSSESPETEVVTRNKNTFGILLSRRRNEYVREKKNLTVTEQGTLRTSARSSLLENKSSDEDEIDTEEKMAEGALDVSNGITPTDIQPTFVLVNGKQKLFAKKERKLHRT